MIPVGLYTIRYIKHAHRIFIRQNLSFLDGLATWYIKFIREFGTSNFGYSMVYVIRFHVMAEEHYAVYA